MALDVNSGEYKSTVGLDNLYVAEVTADSASGYTADTPEYLAPAAEVSHEPTSSLDTQYADDQPYDVMASEGPSKLTLTVTGIPLAMLAKLLGKQFDATTGRLYDYAGTPPDIALGFRSKKSNGKYRYFWYLKGKFSPPKEGMKTLGEKAEPATQQLEFTAIPTIYPFTVASGVTKKTKRVVGDEDSDNFSATNWFAAVQTPSIGSISALALSSSDPIDGAENIAVDKTITLTFNNALPADAITNVIVAAADGTHIACANSLDVTKKILTINPTSNLSASTTYIVTYGLTDLYGQTLKGAINFATAA